MGSWLHPCLGALPPCQALDAPDPSFGRRGDGRKVFQLPLFAAETEALAALWCGNEGTQKDSRYVIKLKSLLHIVVSKGRCYLLVAEMFHI